MLVIERPMGVSAKQQESQIQITRESLMKQVAEMKQQIARIQQQSLLEMQKTIDLVFAAQVADSLQEIINQLQDPNSAIPPKEL